MVHIYIPIIYDDLPSKSRFIHVVHILPFPLILCQSVTRRQDVTLIRALRDSNVSKLRVGGWVEKGELL